MSRARRQRPRRKRGGFVKGMSRQDVSADVCSLGVEAALDRRRDGGTRRLLLRAAHGSAPLETGP